MGQMKNKKNGKRSEEPGQQSEQSNEAKEKVNKMNPKGEIVLGVFIHCEGCANEVVNCLRGFDGVEVIEIDAKNHKVTVKGKKADPIKVTERLRKKSGKHVELISPIPPKDKEEKKDEKKKYCIYIYIYMKIFVYDSLTCDAGCAKDVKYCIHKMEGVQTVDPDMKTSLVKVKGVFEPEKLVEFVQKRAGRHAEIVKPDKKNGNVKKEERNTSVKEEWLYPNYHRELLYAPQLFSDENPNSCVLM
ncbi:unnamed protein product [Ilex paraguariensis]|uniref:HMA domain-containing protein n=1 Tax=Ilex paraguariensis TaxID=185542 RepID=A0ABC8RQP3_9AQUA